MGRCLALAFWQPRFEFSRLFVTLLFAPSRACLLSSLLTCLLPRGAGHGARAGSLPWVLSGDGRLYNGQHSRGGPGSASLYRDGANRLEPTATDPSLRNPSTPQSPNPQSLNPRMTQSPKPRPRSPTPSTESYNVGFAPSPCSTSTRRPRTSKIANSEPQIPIFCRFSYLSSFTRLSRWRSLQTLPRLPRRGRRHRGG